MPKKKGRGWTHAGAYASLAQAEQRMISLKPKFTETIVQEGSKGEAWGRKKKAFRVWVR